MSKFGIGDLVQIDDMKRVYHRCTGKIVAIVVSSIPKRIMYEVGGVVGCTCPIRVSEENLVLVSSDIEKHDGILIPKIKNVILNDPAVIVMWEDGTKTVVKAQGEKFDPEKGLAMAISKKALGNKHSYYGVFLKNIPGLKKKLKKKGAK